MGARLATFKKPEDAEAAINSLYQLSQKPTKEYNAGTKKAEFGGDRWYWIGLSNINSKNGRWRWVGGGPEDTLDYKMFWAPGFPGNYDEKKPPERCVLLANPDFQADIRHAFAEKGCTGAYYFICEETVTPVEKLVNSVMRTNQFT